jgi:hypothetical protein
MSKRVFSLMILSGFTIALLSLGPLAHSQEEVNLEERLSRIEGLLTQMDKRLSHLETMIAENRGEIAENFRWTIGIILGTWITLVLAILFTRPGRSKRA